MSDTYQKTRGYMRSTDERYMARALQLAAATHYSVEPNPMVGAVIVCEDKIIGEGFHACCGGPHAEINAMRGVADPSLLKKSTMYVTLEPCSHYGKTPPCAKAILEHQIPRVVVGCLDPFPQVSGRGIRMMQEGGVAVTVGVLEKECLALNKRFISFQTKKRPYIILKWAQSADGFLDYKRSSVTEQVAVISTPVIQTMVHKIRSEVQAILVGTQTALLDNPSLNVRYWSGASPLRIVLDRTLRIPEHYKLLDDSLPTWVVTEQTHPSTENTTYVRIDFEKEGLPALLDSMYANNIQSLLVEGGAKTLQSFIDSSLWDEAYIETGAKSFGDGVAAPILSNACLQSEPKLVDHHLLTHYRKY